MLIGLNSDKSRLHLKSLQFFQSLENKIKTFGPNDESQVRTQSDLPIFLNALGLRN